MKPVLLDIQSHIVKIGSNPEMADFDNPSGALFGFEAIVYLEEADGSRYANLHTFRDYSEGVAMDQASGFLKRITTAMKHGYVLQPSKWVEIEPRYGSDAYSNKGTEYHQAQEERNTVYDRVG